MKAIYIITPCLNVSSTIEQTLYSVFNQDVNFHIYYHVQDGGSSDGTQDILEKFSEDVKSSNKRDKFSFSWCSQKDKGIYHAINIAADSLNIPDDTFMGWINADDLLYKDAFKHISQVVDTFPQIHWLGGKQLATDMAGNVLPQFRLTRYNQRFIQYGLYDGIHWEFIQQEGSFWRKSLWDAAGGLDDNIRLAGDWDLWRRMAQHAPYVQLPWHTGIFRKRPGQLSQDRSVYVAELEKLLPAKLRRENLKKLVFEVDKLTVPFVTISTTGNLKLDELPLLSEEYSVLKTKLRLLLLSYGFSTVVTCCQRVLHAIKYQKLKELERHDA